MKKGIHPPMYDNAVTTCTTCGAKYAIPSTVKQQSVEVCRLCHPVYTGKRELERKGGRIERFRKRVEAGKHIIAKHAGVKSATRAKSAGTKRKR